MEDGLIPLSDIADTLIDALGAHLGTYTFSVGAPIPAIRADDGSNPLPEEPTVTGLEVILVRAPEIPLKPMLANQWQHSVSTVIILKQWDITLDALEAFNACWRAIARLGLQPSQPVRTMRTSKLDNMETVRFSYTETFVMEP